MLNRVLVTGGTGFLGVYIVQALVQKGIAVRAIRRSDALPFYLPKDIAAKVEWVPGDVLDVVALDEAMEGVDAVIHAAAGVSFHEADRQLMQQVNVEGTANVVNMAIERGVRRIVHISSVAALGRSIKAEVVNEDRKWTESKRNTAYAVSKHAAEMEVWRGFAEGLEGVILNPSTIQIDRIMEARGFRMGPFRLMDLIGHDVNYAVSCSVYEQLGRPERLQPSYLQEAKVQAGELGKKTGKGFFEW